MYIPDLVKKHALRRGLRKNTIISYQDCLKRFLSYYYNKDIKKITKKDVENYLDHLIENGCSNSTVNVCLCSLKFLFSEILGKKLLVKIRFSKTPKKIPVVLSKIEIIKLLEAIQNPKHNLMISLMYSTGLRVSELINLKIKDIDFERNCGWVRDKKGGKDKHFILAEKLRNRLKEHILNKRDVKRSYLFKENKDKISRSSIQKIIKNSAKKAGIKKNVHPHTLRHSFSTHLIEDGAGMHSVQNLLGHNSPDTTMMYIHIAKTNLFSVTSPYDNLELNKK